MSSKSKYFILIVLFKLILLSATIYFNFNSSTDAIDEKREKLRQPVDKKIRDSIHQDILKSIDTIRQQNNL